MVSLPEVKVLKVQTVFVMNFLFLHLQEQGTKSRTCRTSPGGLHRDPETRRHLDDEQVLPRWAPQRDYQTHRLDLTWVRFYKMIRTKCFGH